MKLLHRALLTVACLGLAASMAIAQGGGAGTKTTPANYAAKVKAKVYTCDKCHMASTHGGKCPGCGAKMSAIHAKYVYACEDCHTQAASAGKCPKCGKPMEKMAVTYACEACHTTAKKAGNCPKCGKAMKKNVLHMMPS